MRLRRWRRHSERGQATIEFLIVFPLLFSLFLLALAVAAVWSGHHLSSAVSLEGASRESVQWGMGSSFVSGTGNSVSANSHFGTEVVDYIPGTRDIPPGKRFTVYGTVAVPWAPLGLNWNVQVRGTTFYPDWEFWGR